MKKGIKKRVSHFLDGCCGLARVARYSAPGDCRALVLFLRGEFKCKAISPQLRRHLPKPLDFKLREGGGRLVIDLV